MQIPGNPHLSDKEPSFKAIHIYRMHSETLLRYFGFQCFASDAGHMNIPGNFHLSDK